jgi:hypothetical protein
MFCRGVAAVVDDYCLQSGDFVGFKERRQGSDLQRRLHPLQRAEPDTLATTTIGPVLATEPGIHMAIQMPICVGWASLHVVLIKVCESVPATLRRQLRVQLPTQSFHLKF